MRIVLLSVIVGLGPKIALGQELDSSAALAGSTEPADSTELAGSAEPANSAELAGSAEPASGKTLYLPWLRKGFAEPPRLTWRLDTHAQGLTAQTREGAGTSAVLGAEGELVLGLPYLIQARARGSANMAAGAVEATEASHELALASPPGFAATEIRHRRIWRGLPRLDSPRRYLASPYGEDAVGLRCAAFDAADDRMKASVLRFDMEWIQRWQDGAVQDAAYHKGFLLDFVALGAMEVKPGGTTLGMETMRVTLNRSRAGVEQAQTVAVEVLHIYGRGASGFGADIRLGAADVHMPVTHCSTSSDGCRDANLDIRIDGADEQRSGGIQYTYEWYPTHDGYLAHDHRLRIDSARPMLDGTLSTRAYGARTRLWRSVDDMTVTYTGGVAATYTRVLPRALVLAVSAELARSFYATLTESGEPVASLGARAGITLSRRFGHAGHLGANHRRTWD